MVALLMACMMPVACGGVSSEVEGPDAPAIADGEVSPEVTTINPGDTVQLKATAVAQTGDTVDAQFSWTSSDPSVATVDDEGITAGVAPGRARIIAAAADVGDTAVVDVVEESPPADFVEDFSAYSSESGFINDSESIYQEASDDGRSHIHLDTGVGVNVDGFDLSQSMRFDWPDRTDSGNRCGDFSIGRVLDLGESGVGIGNTKQIWAEFYIRWENGFTVQAPGSWNCSSAPRLKTIFVSIISDDGGTGPGRFGLTMGPGFYHFGLPNNASQGSQEFTQNWNDGEWHRVRVAVILDDAPSASGNGTEVRWWVDGTLAAEWTGIDAGVRDLWSLKLGANMNQGPGQQQSNWYGRVAVWTSDPGW